MLGSATRPRAKLSVWIDRARNEAPAAESGLESGSGSDAEDEAGLDAGEEKGGSGATTFPFPTDGARDADWWREVPTIAVEGHMLDFRQRLPLHGGVW